MDVESDDAHDFESLRKSLTPVDTWGLMIWAFSAGNYSTKISVACNSPAVNSEQLAATSDSLFVFIFSAIFPMQISNKCCVPPVNLPSNNCLRHTPDEADELGPSVAKLRPEIYVR
jgi:hypothetical protein